MTIFSFALKRALRTPTHLIVLLILPLALIALPVEERTGIPLGYSYFGLVLFYSASMLVHFIMEDRVKGIVIRVAAAPITHLQYLWQNLLAYALLLVGQSVVLSVGCMLVHEQSAASSLQFLIVFIFFSLAVIGFSLSWCTLFRSKEASVTIMFILIMIMAMLGGMTWPIQNMPELLQRFVMILPTYWLVEAITSISEGASAIELTLPLAILLLFAIVCLLLGSKGKIH